MSENHDTKLKIYLHVGQPKSGTTAIQRAFANHSDKDLSPIVYYPVAGRRERKLVGHHNLAYELYDPAKFKADLGSWSDMATEIRASNAKKVLVSTEAFRAFLAPVVSAKVRKLFPGSELSVVLYLRPQWEYVESGYNQLLRFGQIDKSLEEFWSDTGKRICDYRSTVNAWDKATGEQSVKCLPFDKSVRDMGIVAHFVRNALISASDFNDTARVNNRIGLMAMSGVRYCRDRLREIQGQDGSNLPAGLVMKLSNLFRDYDRDGQNYSFMSPKLLNEIYDESLATNRWLAERFPVFGAPAFLDRPEPSLAPLVSELPCLSANEKAICDALIRDLVAARK